MNEKFEQNWAFLSKAHVNLREPKGTKPTPLYLVFKLNDKQYKIPLGVKIIPSHWNKKNCVALISSSLSEMENRNNFIANNKINEIKLVYHNFLTYLCNNLNENPSDVIPKFFEMKKKKEKELISATLLTALTNKKLAKSSFNIFFSQLQEFFEFIKKTHNGISLDDFTVEIFNEYKDYLFNKKVTHKITGEKVLSENNTVLGKLKNILTVIGYIDGTEEQLNKLRKVTKNIKSFNQFENQVYLTSDEIDRIYALELKGTEEKARDLFIFQLSSGQRYSDIAKLANIDLKGYINGDIITIVQKKTKTKVSFPIDDMAKSILEKYNYVLPFLTNANMNIYIKSFGQKANINEMCHCVELRGDETYEYDAEKYKLIGTHTTRRSFISNAIKDNIDTAIIRKISGHKTDSAFNRYNRIDSEDAVKALLNASRRSGNTPTIASNDNDGQSTVNDIKLVLAMFDVPSYEWIELTDIEKLYRLLITYENKICERIGCNYSVLKDLFNNNDLSLKEKVIMLRNKLLNS